MKIEINTTYVPRHSTQEAAAEDLKHLNGVLLGETPVLDNKANAEGEIGPGVP